MLQSGAADIAMQIDPDTAQPSISEDVVTDRDGAVVQLHLRRASARAPRPTRCRSPWRCARRLALALDYDGIIDFTLGGEGKPQASPIPNGFPGTDDLPMPVEDLDKAKQLLAEAGLGGRLRARRRRIRPERLRRRPARPDAEGAAGSGPVDMTTNIQPVASSVWREQISGHGHSAARPASTRRTTSARRSTLSTSSA